MDETLALKTPLKIFCAGAARSALGGLPQAYASQAGQPVEFTLGPVGSLVERLKAGEEADVVVLAAGPLQRLAKEGLVLTESIQVIGAVGFGIAQPKGAPPLRLETADELRAVLLAAQSFAYGDPRKGDTSGVHMADVLDRLGIAQEMASKAVLEPLGLAVAEAVASGRAQIGALQTSIVLARADLQLAGVLPPEYQHTTTYAMGCVADAPPAARDLLAYLQTATARAQFVAAGFAPAA